MVDLLLSACEISQIINDLPIGKAAGNNNLTAENLKCVLNLFIILTLFINQCCYMPHCLIGGVIVHIIKNKNRQITDVNNYA